MTYTPVTRPDSTEQSASRQLRGVQPRTSGYIPSMRRPGTSVLAVTPEPSRRFALLATTAAFVATVVLIAAAASFVATAAHGETMLTDLGELPGLAPPPELDWASIAPIEVSLFPPSKPSDRRAGP